MGQPKTTIELNGKLYDASTGAMVQAPAKTTKAPTPKNGASMDGFFRPSHSTPPKQASPRHTTNTKPASRKPQHAQTLMRHVVKKPAATPVTGTAAASASAKSSKPALPTSHLTERQQRAKKVAKSSSISRFGSVSKTQPAIDKKVGHLAVQPHPNAPAASEPPIQVAASASHQASAGETSFNKALETAQSHQQTRPKTQKIHHRAAKKLGVSTRALNIASVSLVIILLFGFVAYQSAPNVSMYIAGNRAGFQGTLPGYTPSGFGLSGPIKATPGNITVSFRSHTDDRTYSVSQQPSNWTSDSLRFNFFKSTDSPVALLDKGKTIYFYNGGANAAWVNGGVLYQVTGNAGLSSDQVVSIADSL